MCGSFCVRLGDDVSSTRLRSSEKVRSPLHADACSANSSIPALSSWDSRVHDALTLYIVADRRIRRHKTQAGPLTDDDGNSRLREKEDQSGVLIYFFRSPG